MEMDLDIPSDKNILEQKIQRFASQSFSKIEKEETDSYI